MIRIMSDFEIYCLRQFSNAFKLITGLPVGFENPEKFQTIKRGARPE